MEAKYCNYSIDLCNARMMELMENEKLENEKHINMETIGKWFPISLYNTIMLLMENEKQIDLETLCNKFPFFSAQQQDAIDGK